MWSRLAAGKLVVQGRALPADHSWLFDAGLYFGFSTVGGGVLVLIKALLVTGMSLILLLSGREGRNVGLSAMTALVALICMAPWLALKPMTLSCFFLALALLLLQRGQRKLNLLAASDTRGRRSLYCFWPLLPLFALWVNVDSWFFLGPLVTACFVGGTMLSGGAASSRARTTLLVTLAASVCVCLCNPEHVRAFRGPAEWWFSEAAARLQQDAPLHMQLVRPFHDTYFSANALRTPAGLAYWLLILSGLLSFVLDRSSRISWRSLVWGTLLILSFFQTHAVAFFAVVAAPITALNFGEFLAGRQPGAAAAFRRHFARRAGHGALVLAELAFVAVAWTGVAQGSLGPRTWRIEENEALVRAAKQVTSWQREEPTSLGTGLLFSPVVANSFAWFCPSEQGFPGADWLMNPQSLDEFLAVRQGLLEQSTTDAAGGAGGAWRTILRKRDVRHVVLYDPHRGLTEGAFGRLLARPAEWPLLYLKDGVAIFGWRDPESPAEARRFSTGEVNLDRLAFASTPTDAALLTWPGREPERYHWWDAFWKAHATLSPELDEAGMALVYHDALRPQFARRHASLWRNYLASQLVLAGTSLSLPAMQGWTQVVTGPESRSALVLSNGDGPRAPLYLAIRAVRRATHKGQIDNARAYLLLGEAYHALCNSRERGWAAQNPILARIRTTQAIYAFTQAVRLDPDSDQAHLHLEALYRSIPYFDMALHHRKEVLRIFRWRGPAPGETRQHFAERLAHLEKTVHEQQQIIDKRQADVDLSTTELKIFDRAYYMGSKGLAGKALRILLNSDIAAFGDEGMDLEMKLLLNTGEMDKIRSWMTPEHEEPLGVLTYRLNRVLLGAATGDYQDLDDQFQIVVQKVTGISPRPLTSQQMAGFIVGHAALDSSSCILYNMPVPPIITARGKGTPVLTMLPDHHAAPTLLWILADKMTEEAKILVLRGLLALEAGRTDLARKCFQDSLAFWTSEACRLLKRTGVLEHQIAAENLRLLDAH